MKNLILYGSQNLSNKKFGIENASELRGSMFSIQKINNARFPGSTIVDKKVSDKSINVSCVLRATDNLTLRDVENEYAKALNEEDRYFRICRNYHVFTQMEDYLGWQYQGDATSLEFDDDVFQYGDGSIKFNSDVSEANTYTGISTEQATEYNLGPYDGNGSFELWVYLPQVLGISTIELAIGNNTSNYYSGTTTEQYDDTEFRIGWNFISLKLSEMSITGTIDPYNFGSYISVKINYNGSMTDHDDFRVGGVLWQEEDETVNYNSYISGFMVDSQHYDISRANGRLSVVAYEGIAESTHEYNVLGLRDQVGATATGSVDLDGSFTPSPIITVDIKSATNVSGITLSNTTTGDSVSVDRTYSAGEILIIDTDNREVTVGGESQDYDDVLPRFVLGNNDIQISIKTTGEESLEYETQDSNLTGEV